jgi:pyruvate dehydrogenase E2 component (dihydrolipoamide acetyltransferase)
MSVSVSMPQLGESVTEGTVTRWLKREGERVEADEPLLEVSTDKVDTEIPSPVSGIVRGITVAEDETVAVGAELAVIDEDGAAPQPVRAQAYEPGPYEQPYPEPERGPAEEPAAQPSGTFWQPQQPGFEPQQPAASPVAEMPQVAPPPPAPPAADADAAPASPPVTPPPAAPPPPYVSPSPVPPAAAEPVAVPQQPAVPPAAEAPVAEPPAAEPSGVAPAPAEPLPPEPPVPPEPRADVLPPAGPPAAVPPPAEPPGAAAAAGLQTAGAPAVHDGAEPRPAADSPYVTPLVRKLAAEHGIDLTTVPGTGVGGRVRKQDVLEAARVLRGAAADAPQVAQPAAAAPPVPTPPPAPPAAQPAPPAAQPAPPAAQPAPPAAPPAPAAPVPAEPVAAQPAPARPAPGQPAAPPRAAEPPAAAGAGAAVTRPAVVPSSLRGRTEKLSRSRQVIAQRMMESLQSSAQLTTVVEADVTAIARLRDRARGSFEAREGARLSFLPFFALATVEALKVHPVLNAVIDTASGQVTYHDAEHLGIAVDTERGLMVPVIRKAGDLNLAGLARKIADLAERTRAGKVSPDELSGGTFTLTNTGSRGALFDTPIINQPQVGILGTGTVVRRPVVVDDPVLGEVIAVRSMVYLALTYDHRLVDGADAARFLGTLKARLEEGAFEAELGL